MLSVLKEKHELEDQGRSGSEKDMWKMEMVGRSPPSPPPPTRGDLEPLVLGSSEPNPEEPLCGGGAQGGSGSSAPNWIPDCGGPG